MWALEDWLGAVKSPRCLGRRAEKLLSAAADTVDDDDDEDIFIILIKLAQAGLVKVYNSLYISFNCWH